MTKISVYTRRRTAAVIDGLVTLALIITVNAIRDVAGISIPAVNVAMFFLALSYEPVCWMTSATLGQLFTGVRVRDYDTNRKPGIYQAYLRYFYKVVLGWRNYLFYNGFTDRGVHDNIAGTLVNMKRNNVLPQPHQKVRK